MQLASDDIVCAGVRMGLRTGVMSILTYDVRGTGGEGLPWDSSDTIRCFGADDPKASAEEQSVHVDSL